MKRIIALILLLILFPLGSSIRAEEVEVNKEQLIEEVRSLKKDLQLLKQLITKQEETINKLQQQTEEAYQKATPPSEQSIKPSLAKQPSPTSLNLTAVPDIGVVGDIVGIKSDTLTEDEGNDRFSVRELELVIGGDVDPYSRYDVTVAFSDSEHVHLEEAYASYWGLPLGIKGRIGRMHQYIGKASTMHRDSLPTVDEPLVIQRYLGTEGFYRTGVDFAGFTPLSTDSYTQQLVLGMMEGGTGEGGQLFGDAQDKPSFYGRLSNFWEISEMSNFELGGTYLLGSADDDSRLEVNSFGIDATLIHHLTPINKLTLQSEFFFQNRSKAVVTDSHEGHEHETSLLTSKHEEDEHHNELIEEVASDPESFGFYTLVDYRLSQRWAIGSRYDWVQPIELKSDYLRKEEQAGSLYLTFFQSEFARWRLQYQHAWLLDGNDDDRFFLQGTFAIGTHKHQIQ